VACEKNTGGEVLEFDELIPELNEEGNLLGVSNGDEEDDLGLGPRVLGKFTKSYLESEEREG